MSLHIVFFRDMMEGVETDMIKLDSITLPISLCILMAMLGSLRIMMIPILNISTILTFSFTLLWPMGLYSSISSYTPSVMMSLGIALSGKLLDSNIIFLIL